ncbi:MAG: universal stress protein [Archaeoglobaceae archaeon]
MFERILYPTDFSEVSLHALNHCIPELVKLGAKDVILVHVVDVIPEDILSIDTLEKKAREELEKIKNDLEEKNVDLRYMVDIGSPAGKISTEAVCPSFEIVERAYCEMVDLIVLPTKGKNVVREKLIGSTARNVARRCKIPVLLLRYNWDQKAGKPKNVIDCSQIFERPLIALDFSACSNPITNTVKKLGDKVKEGTLMHIVDYGSEKEIEENMNKAQSELDRYESTFKFPVNKNVDSGEASEKIMDAAVDAGASVVIMGKRGRGMVKEILLGSAANAIMRRSELPVLLVPC